MHDRIAFVKTGWSDEYQGGPVLGRYAHIAQFDEAHERFNFRLTADGRYYGYLPPIGKQQRPPQPKVEDGWLLIFVSARKGTGPLTVVGWYEDAKLHPVDFTRLRRQISTSSSKLLECQRAQLV